MKNIPNFTDIYYMKKLFNNYIKFKYYINKF